MGESEAIEGVYKVLVCADEVRLGMLTAALLSDAGYEMTSVTDARSALAALEADAEIAAVVLDVNLGGDMSAIQFLVALAAADSQVSIVLASGLARWELPEELIGHPLVSGFVAKPFTEEQLVGGVKTAIAKAQA